MCAVEKWVAATDLPRVIEGMLGTISKRNLKLYDNPQQFKESDRVYYISPDWWGKYIKVRPTDKPDFPQLRSEIQAYVNEAQSRPVRLGPVIPEKPGSDRTWIWIYKDVAYKVRGPYSDAQCGLMIMDEFDKERQYFERLKQKHTPGTAETGLPRERIPESVRIEVWRRDGGICARCGSRDSLEYDHIVPVSKGGSNTSRNIELLCEKCNRSKGASVA
jgi:hypothetical protein